MSCQRLSFGLEGCRAAIARPARMATTAPSRKWPSENALSIILQGRRRERVAGFVAIPLDLRDRTGLAVLACIVTSTPGTAWIEYGADSGVLLIHVLDLVDEEAWVTLIKTRYEAMLMEIFE